MDLIPSILYQGAAVTVEYEPDVVPIVLVLFAIKDAEKYSVNLSQETGKEWTGTLNIPDDAPLGEYTYQLRGDSKMLESGVFTVLQGFTAATAAQQRSPAEEQLIKVQASINKITTTGIKAYGISGSFTTRASLADLHKERFRLQTIINKERKAKGLPPLQESAPSHITYTYNP